MTLRKSGSGRNSFHKQFDYLSWLVGESVDRGTSRSFPGTATLPSPNYKAPVSEEPQICVAKNCCSYMQLTLPRTIISSELVLN